MSGEIAVAVVDLWLVVQINIAMPVAIQILVRALSGDLLGADRDPLTGLFNRRAFRDEALGMIIAHRSREDYLHVAVIDVDDFKAINDEHGHQAGDLALVQTARTLRSAASWGVTARIGGEGFAVAAVTGAQRHPDLTHKLCAAIVESSAGQVTASVDVASSPLHGVRGRSQTAAQRRRRHARAIDMRRPLNCGLSWPSNWASTRPVSFARTSSDTDRRTPHRTLRRLMRWSPASSRMYRWPGDLKSWNAPDVPKLPTSTSDAP